MAVKCSLSTTGFKLDPGETGMVQNIIDTYQRKILEKENCQEIRIRMKKSRHGKSFLHEVQGNLIKGKQMFTATVTDYNLYKAISEVFEKLLKEVEHKKRTPRQIK